MKKHPVKTNYLMVAMLLLAVLFTLQSTAQQTVPRFKVVAMAEAGGIHRPFVDSAMLWLNKLAVDSNFTIDYIENADKITDSFLAQYQLFIQLNYAPYAWPAKAVTAFEKYISEGKSGGWIGFHHATLLGEFDGYQIWPWFSTFMGGIRYENYIPGFASATVNVEDKNHPVMKGVPASFVVTKDEWYIYNKSPRPNVRVLASVDENTYSPDTKIKMGDHPVVWINEKMKARNIYIFMGHHPNLFMNEAYKTMFKNAIFWASKK